MPTWSCSLDCGDCSRRGSHHLLSQACLDQRLDLCLHQELPWISTLDFMGTSGVVANLCRVLFHPYQAGAPCSNLLAALNSLRLLWAHSLTAGSEKGETVKYNSETKDSLVVQLPL